jgi:hypothetical protein
LRPLTPRKRGGEIPVSREKEEEETRVEKLGDN